MMAFRFRSICAAAAVVGVVLVSPLASTASTTSNQATNQAAAPQVKIIMLGGSPSDPFWTGVQKGARAAAAGLKSSGASLEYIGPQNYNNFGPDMARINQAVLAKKPSAVISGNWVPGSQSPGLKAFSKAGIPLIEFNSSINTYKSDGALLYIGNDEQMGGVAAGKAMAAAGARKVLFVNTLPGNPTAELRYKGIRAGMKGAGRTTSELNLPSTAFGDPTAVTQAIKGALLKDSKIDGVVGFSQQVATWASDAIRLAGRSGEVKLGGFDVDRSNLNRIAAGRQLFAVDQQAYLQGYYGVTFAFQYVRYGLLPANNWIKTGPLLITKGNITKAQANAKLGLYPTS